MQWPYTVTRRTCLRQFHTALSAYILWLQRKWSLKPVRYCSPQLSCWLFTHMPPQVLTSACESLFLIFQFLVFCLSSKIFPAIPAHLCTSCEYLQFSLLLSWPPVILLLSLASAVKSSLHFTTLIGMALINLLLLIKLFASCYSSQNLPICFPMW